VNDVIVTADRTASSARGERSVAHLKGGLLVAGLLAATGVVYAQSATAPSKPADDGLTYHGITLFGIVDVGLQYQTHGAPTSDYYPAGSANIVQKNSNHSVFGATPNNLSQSRIGLQGIEPVFGDWSGVFKLETFFNPTSGEISDGIKSLVLNNGRPLSQQTTNIDSSVAGQAFQQSYVGLTSPTFGEITFGRQNALIADGISKYDPQGASQAFSVIGLSGTAAGAGVTQDRRFDSALKYAEKYAGIHFAAQFKFNDATGSANTALELDLGGEILGASVDAYYAKVKDAVAASALSAAQVALLPSLGFSSNNSVAATISDNTTYGLMAMYSFGAPKIFAGYEHIQFANPSTQLTAGFDDIGGYKLAFVNNTAFPNDKVLQVFWAGVKYSVLPNLDLTGAFYGYKQNSYGTGANAGCSGKQAGTCSGTLDAFTFSAVQHLSKRFDGYAGIMYTAVHDGLASGYLHTTDMNPTIGMRYKF
jgi:predicted porin